MAHPDDFPAVEQAFEEAVREKKDFETSCRLRLPDGSVRRIRTLGHPVLSESGELREFIGATLDETEQERAKMALRQSEARYREHIRKVSEKMICAFGIRAHDYVNEPRLHDRPVQSEMVHLHDHKKGEG